MTPDFPWLNNYFGEIFGKITDISPLPYKMFYTNLHVGSTYFLAICIILGLALIVFGTARLFSVEGKALKVAEFMYSFFIFGALFSAIISL